MKSLLYCSLFLSCVSAESLHYAIGFQSGVTLGEAALTAEQAEAGWNFGAMVDASIPGFVLRDEYKSSTDAALCSATLERTLQRGKRKSSEKDTFDQDAKSVNRQTIGGGSRQMTTGSCARDAMAFLQVLRTQLAKGEMIKNDPVYLGAKYDLTLTYLGSEKVRRGDRQVDADHVKTNIRGPKSDYTIELFFARDEARTPILARLPLALGTFTVELLQ